MADACIYLMNRYDGNEFVNIGIGKDLTILEAATIIKEEVGFKGSLVFDTSEPDGTPQKLLDVSKLNSLGWKAKTSFRDGIRRTIEWYEKREIANLESQPEAHK
jgi:GDP-L-fucose synthase